MVLLSGTWLFYTGVLVLGEIQPDSTRFFTLEWLATLLYSTLAAALLALALRGSPRIQGIAASLFMWACLQAGNYF